MLVKYKPLIASILIALLAAAGLIAIGTTRNLDIKTTIKQVPYSPIPGYPEKIDVYKNELKISWTNPNPEEVRQKIAAKYGLKAPVFPNPANWTFAVYLDADNNLNDYGEYDFNEMGSVGSDESIGLRIVVLIDKNERGPTPDQVGLWYIEQGDTWNNDYSWADEYWGEQNMADPNILIKFLEDVLYNYSAYHYALVLWDHGGAIYGVCWDDTDGGHLDLQEVRYALKYIYDNYGVIFDIVGFDACLVGMTSFAYELLPYAKVMVGSEESEGADGWPYNEILSNVTGLLQQGIIPDAETFGDIIAWEYIKSYEGTDSYATQSATNLTEFQDLVEPRLSEFANLLLRKYNLYATEIDTARSNTEYFDPFYGYYDYMIDLKHFAMNIYDSITDTEIRTAAQNLINALDTAIISAYHWSGHPNAYGLSIYMPTSSDGWESIYDRDCISHRSMWNEFARKYAAAPYATNFYDMWIVDAIDDDGNGYYEYIKLGWDIDEDSGSGLSVYTNIYALDLFGIEFRKIDDYENSSSEFVIGTSGTYTVTGRVSDTYEMELYNFVSTQSNYAIRANIYDSAGTLKYVLHYYTHDINDDLWNIPIEPDTLAPRLLITTPSDGEILNTQTFDVTFSIDEAYLNQAVLYLNGTPINSYTTEGTYTETITVSGDGVYNITLWADDNAGNENSVTILVTVDTTPPTVTITNPTDGAYVNTTSVTVTWTADDALTGVDYFKIYLDGGYVDQVPASTTSYTLTLSEGSHTIKIEAYDVAGNMEYDQISITVDLTNPTVTITSPEDGSTITTQTGTADITVEWTGSDNYGIDHYEVKLDDGSWIDVGTDTSYTFSGVSEGDHTVYVKAVDLAGNIASDQAEFTITTFEITSPTEDTDTGEAYVGSDSVVLSWLNQSNVDHFEVIVDGGTPVNVGTATNYEVTGLGEGSHNITVVVYYKDTSTNSDYVIVVVDLSPPTLSVTESMKTVDATTTSVTVSWSGDDSVSGVDHYEVYIDGSWVDVGNNTEYTIDTSSMSEGIYAVYVRVFDRAHHYSQKTIMLIIDKSAPNIVLTSPENGSILAFSSVVVTWDCTDNMIGVDHYEVSLDGSSWTNIRRETSYAVTGLSDGTYYVYIRAYDYVGNYVEIMVTFTIDLTPPTVSITSPADGETLSTSDITVTWNGGDENGISHYLVRIDDSSWINVGTSTSHTFNSVSDGIHCIYVVAYDVVGNYAMTYIMVIVDTSISSASSNNVRDVVENDVGEEIIVENTLAEPIKEKIKELGREEVIKPVEIADKAPTIKIIVINVVEKPSSAEQARTSVISLPILSQSHRNRDFVFAMPVITIGENGGEISKTPRILRVTPIIRTMFLAYSMYLIRPPLEPYL